MRIYYFFFTKKITIRYLHTSIIIYSSNWNKKKHKVYTKIITKKKRFLFKWRIWYCLNGASPQWIQWKYRCLLEIQYHWQHEIYILLIPLSSENFITFSAKKRLAEHNFMVSLTSGVRIWIDEMIYITKKPLAHW